MNWNVPESGAAAHRFGFALVMFIVIGSADAAAPEPGQEITAANVAQYAEYMSDSMVTKVKMGEIYRVFPTSPAEKLIYPKWLEMTRNPPQGPAVMLDEAGTVGLADGSPWPGGFPFPKPKSAREIMANFLYHVLPDDIDSSPSGTAYGGIDLVDANGRQYKRQIVNLAHRRMTSRVWVEPIGSQPGHEDELLRTNTLFFEPYDVRGLVSLNIIYRDQARLPDGYVYVPVLRRVRRLSSSQRADSIGGSDLTLGDVDLISDPLGMWDFELLETRKMLSSQNHAANFEFVWNNREAPFVGGRFPTPYSAMEVRDTYVIQATPRYDTIYSKKILYLDAETYRPHLGEFYDQQGKLLKSFSLYWNIQEDFSPGINWINIQNMQTNHSTVVWMQQYANTGTPLSRVLASSMKDFGR